MYLNFGDRGAQAEIRREYPEHTHCTLLMQAATACDGCPKNPYREVDPKVARNNRSLLAWALELSDYAELGALPPIERLTPREAFAARLATIARQRARDEALATQIAGKLGELIAAMLGPGKS